jgi:AAHS family 4-hydroxybenzoate transporter-like MFS transporter
MGRPVATGSEFEDTTERRVRQRTPLRVLLGYSHARDTAGLWLAFLFCLGSIYLVFGWLPALLTAQGMDVASASGALAVYNLGGVVGVFVWAALITSFGSRGPLLWGALAAAASALAILLVPVQPGASAMPMLAALAINGLLSNAVQTSMYALAAHVYPTTARASGIAYAAAIGRAGGILSSVGGATIIGIGAGAYWGVVAASMVIAVAGLASVRSHISPVRHQEPAERVAR